MVAGLIIVPVVSLLTPKMKKEFVEECFSCYNKKVVVENKVALPKEENGEEK